MIDRNQLDQRIASHPASLIGRAYATDDPHDRKNLADWLINLADTLGLDIKDKP